MRKKSMVLLVIAGLHLSGCATLGGGEESSDFPQPRPAEDPAIQNIEKAARHIERLNEVLAQVVRAKHPMKPPTLKPHSASELDTPIYMRDWHGEVTTATTSIARILGYRVILTGKIPVKIPSVYLDANGDPAWRVFESLAAQVEKNADFRFDLKEKVIEIYFRNRRDA